MNERKDKSKVTCHAQGLVFRKGPIWVAAYFFNKLSKATICEIDIPSCVDKILQEEIGATTYYSVMAYLLLGAVRVHSKKVEYLFDDCREALAQLNGTFGALVDKSTSTPADTLRRLSITIPDTFELDAFNLDIEEAGNEDHVLPQEDITLRDTSQTARGKSILYEYNEDFAFNHHTFSGDLPLVEGVCSPYLMDVNMEGPSASSLNDLVERLTGINADHGINDVPETTQLGTQMNYNVVGNVENECTQEETNLEENYHTDPFSEDRYPIGAVLTLEITSSKKHLEEMTSSKKRDRASLGKRVLLHATVDDVTPQSKLSASAGASTAKVTTRRSTTVPAVEGSTRFSKKGKFMDDHAAMVCAKVYNRWLNDSTSLVTRRKRVPGSALAEWRASKVSNISNVLVEPSLTNTSPELRSLFTEKAFASLKSIRIEQNARETDIPGAGEPSESDVSAPTSFERAVIAQDSARRTFVLETPVWGSSAGNSSTPPPSLGPETPALFSGSVSMFDNSADSPNQSYKNEEQEGFTSHDEEELNLTLIDDQDLNSIEGNTEEQNGISERTRIVAKQLNNCFLNESRSEQAVEISQLMKQKTKRERANTFYEILVLATRGCAKVNQDKAYGDIKVSRLPKWDRFLK